MEYQTLNNGDKEVIIRNRVQRLEAEHYDRELSIRLLNGVDQSDEVRAQREKLEFEQDGIERTIEVLLDKGDPELSEVKERPDPVGAHRG